MQRITELELKDTVAATELGSEVAQTKRVLHDQALSRCVGKRITDDALEAAGRDPASMRIVPFGSHPTPDKLEHFASIGVTECVFRLPSAPRDEVLPVLDEQARLVASLRA